MASPNLGRMMKKALSSSSLIPLANQRTPHRNYISANFTSPLKKNTTTSNLSRSTQVSRETLNPTRHNISAQAMKKSNSDDPFLSIVESEIDRAEEKLHKFAEEPMEFPFKIEDHAGERSLTLTRKYQGEEIKVTVETLYCCTPRYYLTGNVSTKSGRNLRFHVTADSEDGITINSFDGLLGYDRPPHAFSDWDENFQKASRTYLEVRGIEPSIASFLHERTVKKKHQKQISWLKNFKNFINAD